MNRLEEFWLRSIAMLKGRNRAGISYTDNIFCLKEKKTWEKGGKKSTDSYNIYRSAKSILIVKLLVKGNPLNLQETN